MLTAAQVLGEQAALQDRVTDWHYADYVAYYMQTIAKKDFSFYRASFYPWVVSAPEAPMDVFQDCARDFCRSQRAGLRQARTYQVTGGMVQLLRNLVDNHDSDRVQHLSEREMPADHGFAWFDQYWQHLDADGNNVAFRAVSWSLCSVTFSGGGQERTSASQVLPAVRMCWWSDNVDYEGDDYFSKDLDPELMADLQAKVGRLTLQSAIVCPFDVRFLGENHGGSLFTMMHLLWMLFDMEITAQERPHLDRKALRRTVRSVPEPDVRVVTLRRARSTAEPSGEHRDVDWSCQWVVQGHTRHLASGKSVWVRPYIKGPDGKPFRLTAGVVHRLSK